MKNINLGMIKILTGYVIELTGVGNSDISQKNRWKNLQIGVVEYWKGNKIMLVKDLLEVLNTDSIILATEDKILLDVETPYVEKSLCPYKDMTVKRITPVQFSMEIIVE